MNGKAKILLIVVGMGVAATAAYASGTLNCLVSVFASGATVVITHTKPIPGQATGPLTTLRIHKGPDQPRGAFDLGFELDIAATGVLTSAVLQTSNDTNDNGVLDESEWTTVATAIITEAAGETHAVSPTAAVTGSPDGYRIVYDRTDIGTIRESWITNPDVDFEN